MYSLYLTFALPPHFQTCTPQMAWKKLNFAGFFVYKGIVIMNPILGSTIDLEEKLCLEAV